MERRGITWKVQHHPAPVLVSDCDQVGGCVAIDIERPDSETGSARRQACCFPEHLARRVAERALLHLLVASRYEADLQALLVAVTGVVPVIVEHGDETGVKIQLPDGVLHGFDVDGQVGRAVVACGLGSAEQPIEDRIGRSVVQHAILGQAVDDFERARWHVTCPLARKQLPQQILAGFPLPVRQHCLGQRKPLHHDGLIAPVVQGDDIRLIRIQVMALPLSPLAYSSGGLAIWARYVAQVITHVPLAD